MLLSQQTSCHLSLFILSWKQEPPSGRWRPLRLLEKHVLSALRPHPHPHPHPQPLVLRGAAGLSFTVLLVFQHLCAGLCFVVIAWFGLPRRKGDMAIMCPPRERRAVFSHPPLGEAYPGAGEKTPSVPLYAHKRVFEVDVQKHTISPLTEMAGVQV